MYKIADLHKLLSQEKKILKPDHAYKPAEEGLLRAYYFFRWLDKKEFKSTNSVVEAFIKDKIPEQQLEHFGTALAMADSYETHEEVKQALLQISDEFRKRTGGDILESIKDTKVKRRVWKNIYTTYESALDRLKNRTEDIKATSRLSWMLIAVVLIADFILLTADAFMTLLLKTVPELMAQNQILKDFGEIIVAIAVFLILSLIILLITGRKIIEFRVKGKQYFEQIPKMEELVDNLRIKMEEQGIQNGTPE